MTSDIRTLPEGLTPRPLVWAHQVRGSAARFAGNCREQKDGNIELYTVCGRYTLRHRESQGHYMWVLRYLTHTVLRAHVKMGVLLKDADQHHLAMLHLDFGLTPPAGPYEALKPSYDDSQLMRR